MVAQRRITDEQRALIARLICVEHRPHRDVKKLCAEGIHGIPGFDVSIASISEIARSERLDGALNLGEAALGEIFDRLARDALTTAHRELERLKATQGKLDADHFLKIARSLRELQPLVKPNMAGQEAKQDTFLGALESQKTNDTATTQEIKQSDSLSPSLNDEPSDQLEDFPVAA